MYSNTASKTLSLIAEATKRRSATLITRCLTAVLLAAAAFGQDTQTTGNTIDQNMRSAGRVNPSTLGMEFDLPLGGYPGRGISMPLGISYSSKQWRFEDDESIQLPGAPKYIFAVAKFSENAAAGWTSSLSQPYIEYTGQYNRFDIYGRPLPGEQLGGGQTSPPGDNYIKRINVFLPGGTTYELRASDAPIANPNHLNYPPESVWEGTFYSTDGSGVKYVQDTAASPAPIFRLYMPDGSYYDFNVDREQKSSTDYTEVRRGTKLTDVHGNYIQFNAPDDQAGYPNGSWTDQLGRTFPIIIPRETPTLKENETVFEQSFYMPGIDEPYILRWKPLLGESERQSDSAFTDVGSQVLHYAGTTSLGQAVSPSLFVSGMRTRPCPSSTSFLHITVPSGVKFNPVVLNEVILPSGAKYTFTYNEFGEVERISYPTGGREEIDYDPVPSLSHMAPPYQQTNRGVTERRIYESDVDSAPDTWEFTAAASDYNYRTSVVAPDATRTDTFMHRGVPTPTCAQENSSGYGQNSFGTRWGYDNILTGRPYDTRVFSSTGHIMHRTLTRYDAATTSVLLRAISSQYVQRNLRAVTTESITYDGDAGLSAAVKTEYDTDVDDYGSPQNAIRTKEYAFLVVSGGNSLSPGEAPPSSSVTLSDPSSSATVARISETDYLNMSTNPALATSKANAATHNVLRLPIASRVKNASGAIVRQNVTTHDESGRGLPISMAFWNNSTNPASYVEASATFDSYGNRTSTTDGNNNTIYVTYDDTYHAFPIKITSPIPDSNGVYGLNSSLIVSTTFDSDTGQVLTTTDPNNQTTSMVYDEDTGRLVSMKAPNDHLTEYAYGVPGSDGRLAPSQRFVRIRSQIDDEKWNDSYAWFDGLGKNIKTQKLDSEGDVFVEKGYDVMGRLKTTSNPYRTGETVVNTENFYDDLGRPTKIKTPDNAEADTYYGLATTGNQIGIMVTVEDQADKQRRSITDAQGNLVRVDEPTDLGGLGPVNNPNQPTVYTYDLLDNLTTVVQGPSGSQQTRNFTYSSLSRLLTTTSPESGTTSYEYDNNGNLTQKSQPRSSSTTITTAYTYDSLNRVRQVSYSGESGSGYTTPTVKYYYDNVENAIGKMIKVESSISKTEYTAYDVMGRPTSHKQTTDGKEYITGYTYNRSGVLIEEIYPSTRKVKTTLDNDGNLSMVQSKKNSAAGLWTYADAFSYDAAGAVTKMQLGNGYWESTQFNNRLQPSQLALGTTSDATDILRLQYAYGKWENGSLNAAKNNGNISRQIITATNDDAPVVFTQVYDYDVLNRIKEATETVSNNQTWKQVFSYDRFGNRNFDETQTTTLTRSCGSSPNFTVCEADRKLENPSISPVTNRIVEQQDGDGLVDYTFDAAGNTTKTANGMTFIYDGENRQVEVKNSSNVTIGQYYYDGNGKRVKKYVPSTGETTIFVYDATGKTVAEYSTVLAVKPEVSYTTTDNLGSPRISTGAHGSIIARHDYHPFGEEIATAQRDADLGYKPDGLRKKFTGYERDNETGLDFAQARMYASHLGRFSTADPVIMRRTRQLDPQQINLYSYVRNNPYKFVDSSGTDLVLAQNLKPKDRDFVVKNLARLYMTKKGRADIEKADKHRFVAEVGPGKLERKELNPSGPGKTVIGGPIHIVGGHTQIPYITIDGRKITVAAESDDPANPKFPTVKIRMDKKNAEEMGKDPAKVAAHEIRHFNNGADEADKPTSDSAGYPGNDITGLDGDKDETSAKDAEKLGEDLPDEPSAEALEAIEKILLPTPPKPKEEEKEKEKEKKP